MKNLVERNNDKTHESYDAWIVMYASERWKRERTHKELMSV